MDRKEYMRQYRITHKERLYKYYCEWKRNNKDRVSVHNKRYYDKNKDLILQRRYEKQFVIEN